MKRITLHFFFFTLFVCAANAQHEVMLHLAPRLGGAAFALDVAFDHPSGSYQMKYTRFEYYVSEIKITHDGGQVTPCTGLHLLVRPAKDSMYSLGQLPDVQNVEAITFSVGVEQAFNHLDPASFPPDDPLAPQNPAMQWGWTAGYRFAAIEGEAGTNLAQHFEIHALGDANYKTQTIATKAEQISPDMKMIHLIADYALTVKSINLANGLIVHGTSGAAVTLLDNFKNIVFSAETASAVLDPAFNGAFSVSPNPAGLDVAPKAFFSIPADANAYAFVISDWSGKLIERRVLSAGENQGLILNKLPGAGLYFLQLWQNERPIALEKLVVLH